MKKTDTLVRRLLPDIQNKTVLEVACGRADFSHSASVYADRVYSIDIVDSRLVNRDGIRFEIMDACAMRYPDEMFDSVFIYNAFSHIETQWGAIEKECRRVTKRHGKIYVIGSWKIDISSMEKAFGDKAKRDGDFLIALPN